MKRFRFRIIWTNVSRLRVSIIRRRRFLRHLLRMDRQLISILQWEMVTLVLSNWRVSKSLIIFHLQDLEVKNFKLMNHWLVTHAIAIINQLRKNFLRILSFPTYSYSSFSFMVNNFFLKNNGRVILIVREKWLSWKISSGNS